MICDFISSSVMSGFLTASAFVIAINQINALFGISVPASYSSPQLKIYYLFTHLTDIQFASFLLGFGSICLIYLGKYWKPYYKEILTDKKDLSSTQTFLKNFPIIASTINSIFSSINIVLIVIGCIIAYLIKNHVDVKVVGPIPFGFPVPNPRFVVSPFSDLKSLFIDSFPLAFAGFAGNWALALKYSQLSIDHHEKEEIKKKSQSPPSTPIEHTENLNKSQNNQMNKISPVDQSPFDLGPYKVDANQEFVASGISNIIGILLGQSMFVSAGLGRTVVNSEAGALSQISHVVAGFLMLILLLILMLFSKIPGLSIITDIFASLPKSVIAAAIITSVPSMMDFPAFKRSYELSTTDFKVMVVTFIFTTFVGVSEGLIIGVVYSVFTIIYPVSFPSVIILGKLQYSEENPLEDLRSSNQNKLEILSATKEMQMKRNLNNEEDLYFDDKSLDHEHVFYKNIQRFPQAKIIPGFLILRMESSPCFINIQLLKVTIRKILHVLANLRLEHNKKVREIEYVDTQVGKKSKRKKHSHKHEKHVQVEKKEKEKYRKKSQHKNKKKIFKEMDLSQEEKIYQLCTKFPDLYTVPIRHIILDASSWSFIDFQAIDTLIELKKELDAYVHLKDDKMKEAERLAKLEAGQTEGDEIGYNSYKKDECVGISLYIAEAKGIIRDSLHFAFRSNKLNPFHFFLTIQDAIENRLPPMNYMKDYIDVNQLNLHENDGDKEDDTDHLLIQKKKKIKRNKNEYTSI